MSPEPKVGPRDFGRVAGGGTGADKNENKNKRTTTSALRATTTRILPPGSAHKDTHSEKIIGQHAL